MRKIPVYQPSLSGREREYVFDCINSSWISSKGGYIPRFEELFANKITTKHATTVCNGTVALHLALLALGIGPEDEVIVPTLTYIASVNAIAYTGAKPVFVDSIRATWQIDPNEVRKKITPRTRAIMAVHLYGHPCEMDAIMQIAEEYRLFVIEDCAEAFGTRYKDKPVGSIGHISAFSFFGNKTITTGEGGMVTTNDQTLYQRAVHFKGQGLAANREYWHDVIGYNYRMTNICAAIGLAQLEQADEFIHKKRLIAAWYREGLSGLPIEMLGEVEGAFSTYWMVSILTRRSEERNALRQHLANHGIETRPLFSPAHTLPMYSSKFQKYPVAEALGRRGINLPSYPGLSVEDVHDIAQTLAKFYSK